MQASRGLSLLGRRGYDEEQLGWKVVGLNPVASKVFHLQNLLKYVYLLAFVVEYEVNAISDCFTQTCERCSLSLINKNGSAKV